MAGAARVAGLLLLASGLCRAELRPGDYSFTLKHQDRERDYIVHVPSTRSAAEWPVVINFHGGGGHAKAQQRYSRMNVVADREGFLVVYPNGSGPFANRLPEITPPRHGTGNSAKHTATRIAYAPCHNGTEVALWKLSGPGHVWPGGDIDYLTWAIGPGTDVIDANTQMWQFFSRFRLDR